jgi:hypothetical protein
MPFDGIAPGYLIAMGGILLRLAPVLGAALTVAACGASANSHTAGPATAPVVASTTTLARASNLGPGKAGAGLPSITPPPDADGNPPCHAFDGWNISSAGDGISLFYWSAGPDHVTAVVRQKDGTDISQSADIDPGQQMHQFDFNGIDSTTVKEVLVMTNSVRCFAMPGSAVASG